MFLEISHRGLSIDARSIPTAGFEIFSENFHFFTGAEGGSASLDFKTSSDMFGIPGPGFFFYFKSLALFNTKKSR